MISIIVPIFNCEAYLDRCICSILNQTYTDFELLLIDDGSTDASYPICKKYQQNDCRIRLYRQSNHGVSYCRNCGMKLACGDYIQFVDADDWLSANCLETLFFAMIQTGSIVTVCSYTDCFEGVLHQIPLNLRTEGSILTRDFLQHFGAANEFSMVWGSCWNKLFDLRFLTENQFEFNETLNLHEDSVFMFQIYQIIDSLFVIDTPLYYYVHHRNYSNLTDKYHENILEMTQTFYKEEFLLFYSLQLNSMYLYDNFYNNCYQAGLSSILSFMRHNRGQKTKILKKLVLLTCDSLFLESVYHLQKIHFYDKIIHYCLQRNKLHLLYFILSLILLVKG